MRLSRASWINAGGIVVLEENEKADVPEVAGLTLIDERSYGETKVRFYRLTILFPSPLWARGQGYRRPNSLSISASFNSTKVGRP